MLDGVRRVGGHGRMVEVVSGCLIFTAAEQVMLLEHVGKKWTFIKRGVGGVGWGGCPR